MNELKVLNKSFSQLKKLLIYRNILEDSLVCILEDIILKISTEEDNVAEVKGKFYIFCSKLIEIGEKEKYENKIWQSYLLDLIIGDENIFTIRSEKYGSNIGYNLKQSARHDLKILKSLFKYDLAFIGKIIGEDIDFLLNFSPTSNYSVKLPYLIEFNDFRNMFRGESKKSVDKLVDKLIKYYYSYGTGIMAHYTTFRWDKGQLKGIKNPDPVTFTDLIGYEKQKEQLIYNTEKFIKGRRANNVLLFGNSGTGKSSSVKALANKFSGSGLRLIEIDKQQIKDLPAILRILKERGLYYIIFMDDLSFSDFETGYKYLKALMEGGVEVKPDNVLFYATSNRRHIIKEKWSDRNGESREIHLTDAIQEKFSLSDRFGLTINYQSPGKKEFLEIVKELAKRYRIGISDEKLEEKALVWERRYHSMSGRSAQQFINYLADKKE